jgi:hypothetical protein
MSCSTPTFKERLVELLGRDGELPAAADVKQHVAGCGECARELDDLRQSWSLLESTLAPPSPAALARARLAALGAPRPRIAASAVVGLVAAVSVLLALGLNRANVDLLSLLATAVLVPAYALGLYAAVSGRASIRLAFLGAAVPGLALSILSQPGASPDGAICLPLAALLGAAPLAVTALQLRRADLSAVDGAFWGASAGVLATALFRLHCPYHGYQHALLFHATLVPILAAAGSLAARVFYKRTPRSTMLATEK